MNFIGILIKRLSKAKTKQKKEFQSFLLLMKISLLLIDYDLTVRMHQPSNTLYRKKFFDDEGSCHYLYIYSRS